ncbi:transcriptional regulator [Peptoanaerobacter stomatis]|uniref:transcriptional regulator n=1 Tax=Peptoanaerobacter stomatis TaxID=796937 RepID=UPI003FA006BC
MLSKFGKFTRKLRIERNELLSHMAEKLKVSSSFLSAVENGKKSVPNKWPDSIKDIYELSSKESLELDKAYLDSINSISLNMENKNEEDKEIILSFARKFDSLDNKSKEELKNIFEIVGGYDEL